VARDPAEQGVLNARAWGVTEAFDRIADGGRTFVIIGDSGAGKSVLLAAAADEATRRGMVVLSAFGSDAEHHLPFGALFQLVHPVVDRAAELPPGHRAALLGALGLSAEGAPPDRCTSPSRSWS
jgi:hypothetical protein